MKFQILLFLSVYTALLGSNAKAGATILSNDGHGHAGCTGSLELTPSIPRGTIE